MIFDKKNQLYVYFSIFYFGNCLCIDNKTNKKCEWKFLMNFRLCYTYIYIVSPFVLQCVKMEHNISTLHVYIYIKIYICCNMYEMEYKIYIFFHPYPCDECDNLDSKLCYVCTFDTHISIEIKFATTKLYKKG